MKTIFDELKQEVKNWWVSLILGILYVAVALGLMFFPFNGYAALSILFSISMLVSGLLEIAFAVSNRQRVSSWGWYLAHPFQAKDLENMLDLLDCKNRDEMIKRVKEIFGGSGLF